MSIDKKLKIAINRTFRRIEKKIYDLMYRRVTYIPEKNAWVSTVIFPRKIGDGIRGDIIGITDAFKGDEKGVSDWMPFYSLYLEFASNAKANHETIVSLIKNGDMDGDIKEM